MTRRVGDETRTHLLSAPIGLAVAVGGNDYGHRTRGIEGPEPIAAKPSVGISRRSSWLSIPPQKAHPLS